MSTWHLRPDLSENEPRTSPKPSSATVLSMLAHGKSPFNRFFKLAHCIISHVGHYFQDMSLSIHSMEGAFNVPNLYDRTKHLGSSLPLTLSHTQYQTLIQSCQVYLQHVFSASDVATTAFTITFLSQTANI